jgi:hypothetical protein
MLRVPGDQQSIDNIIEPREQISGLIGSANGQRQQYSRDTGALG